MSRMFGYLKDYFLQVDKRTLVLSTLLAAAFIFINYYFKLQPDLAKLNYRAKFFCWYSIFLIAFALPYLFNFFLKNFLPTSKTFYLLLFIAPAIFAWKMATPLHFEIFYNDEKNIYWNKVLYWPIKLIIVSSFLWLIWKLQKDEQQLYGLTTKNITLSPYALMLLIMIPLIAIASTQPDFLSVYPKIQNVNFLTNQHNIGYTLLYELSYGSDFFTIELFFRGFLILAFARYAGTDTILPMAVFYCTIHFGKPLGECISSFFGGIILGVVTYNTRSIYGGLMVHLGIAWLMELGGYLGNNFLAD